MASMLSRVHGAYAREPQILVSLPTAHGFV
jgi:hypothetical protein